MPTIDRRPRFVNPGLVIVEFTEQELIDILRQYCAASSIDLPNGPITVWGLDRGDGRSRRGITLATQVPEPQA